MNDEIPEIAESLHLADGNVVHIAPAQAPLKPGEDGLHNNGPETWWLWHNGEWWELEGYNYRNKYGISQHCKEEIISDIVKGADTDGD